MRHRSKKLFTLRNIIDIEFVGSCRKLLLVILDDLVAFRFRLSFSLIDIDKREVGEEICNDIAILQNFDLKFSVIEVCHTDSYIIFSFIICDTFDRGLCVLFNCVLIIHIAVSIAIGLVQDIRINVYGVLAILFDDLCRILVSFCITFVKDIVDLREYDIAVIYIFSRVLRRYYGIIRVVQSRFKCKLFYSEFSALDGLLGAKHQASLSIVLIRNICKIDIVLAGGYNLIVDLDLHIESFRIIIAGDFDFNGMFGRIIGNSALIARFFLDRVVEGLLVTGDIAITVFDLIKVAGLEQDLTEPGLTVCIIRLCDRIRRSICSITCCLACRSTVQSCQGKLIISGFNSHIASDQLLESTEFYFTLIRLILNADSCRRQIDIAFRVSCLAVQTVCKFNRYDIVDQLISGRSRNFLQRPLAGIHSTFMST